MTHEPTHEPNLERWLELPVPKYYVERGANAFQIMGNFQRAARQAGWGTDDLNAFIKLLTSGDYETLCDTIDTICFPY